MTERDDEAGQLGNDGEPTMAIQEPLTEVATRLGRDPKTAESSKEITETVEETATNQPEAFEGVVEEFVADLDSSSADDRLAATKTLYELSGIVPGVLSTSVWPLLDRLDESTTRPYAGGAISRIFHHSKDTGLPPETVKQRLRGDMETRRHAARYCLWLTKDGWRRYKNSFVETVPPTLVDLLEESDDATRRYATTALCHLGRPSSPEYRSSEAKPQLIELVNDSDPTTRGSAFSLFGAYIRDGSYTSSELDTFGEVAVDQLRDEEVTVRLSAITTLEDTYGWTYLLSEKHREQVAEALVDCLRADNQLLRDRAGERLSRMSEEHPAALRPVVAALVDTALEADLPGDGVLPAIVTVAELDPELTAAHAERFVAMIADLDVEDHYSGYPKVADTLRYVAQADPDEVLDAVQPLHAGLESRIPTYRAASARALAAIGKRRPDAVPDIVEPLVGAIDDSAVDTDERWEPLETLAETHPSYVSGLAVTFCERGIEEGWNSIGWRFSTVADTNSSVLEPAMPIIADALTDSDPEVRSFAVSTVTHIDDDHGTLLTSIVEPLAAVLPTLGTYDRRRVLPLIAAAANEEPQKVILVIDALMPYLTDLDRGTRIAVARTLVYISDANQDIIPTFAIPLVENGIPEAIQTDEENAELHWPLDTLTETDPQRIETILSEHVEAFLDREPADFPPDWSNWNRSMGGFVVDVATVAPERAKAHVNTLMRAFEASDTPLRKQILPTIRPVAEDAPELVVDEIDVLANALTDEELGNDPRANAAWALTALHEEAPTKVSTAISSRFDILADDVPPGIHLGFHLNDALDALEEKINSERS